MVNGNPICKCSDHFPAPSKLSSRTSLQRKGLQSPSQLNVSGSSIKQEFGTSWRQEVGGSRPVSQPAHRGSDFPIPRLLYTVLDSLLAISFHPFPLVDHAALAPCLQPFGAVPTFSCISRPHPGPTRYVSFSTVHVTTPAFPRSM